ncbi:glycoside hydrolase family 65 protein [Pelagicoccus mobilis]|uniref:Family 65 glycosyl hydrolase n=1 Tax=Pelagicoccus mobilis TaxID=415221 RepID=A0A934RVM1_9BACT|nr:glycosyl hydrolase family 65 protein [Pelagicoccus mobilis]MBK1877213.1 hypothetical protein [Pelagicoccus mobilis]
MAKTAHRYLEIAPWVVEERGFNEERSEVSESIFALANEFMGVRGSFEEGYSGQTTQGSFFNGIYESGEHIYSTKFKGFADGWTYMVNSVDWLYTRIRLDDELLDLAKISFRDFSRKVDMRTGIVERSFVWDSASGKSIRIKFERMLSMHTSHLGVQQISLEAINFTGVVEIDVGLDFGVTYNLRQSQPWSLLKHEASSTHAASLGRTSSSGHRVFSSLHLKTSRDVETSTFHLDRLVGATVKMELEPNKVETITRIAANHSEKDSDLSDDTVWTSGFLKLKAEKNTTWESALKNQRSYWESVWKQVDVTIEGDDENQQGFRFCIFHLLQTYRGEDPRHNIGAKGLTGEHYWGVTWWDTETYCLPFYLFNNRRAAKNLVTYRHHTLPGAQKRARELHLEGARYPMCTIDGDEICDVWQHGDLEIHVSAAIAYGIWKYVHITGDKEFLRDHGAEILIEVARFYASRGGWGQRTGKFGYWGVMGPDEMHTMVNNNAYTNILAKKSFEWALEVLDELSKEAPEALSAIKAKTKLQEAELSDWKKKAENMDTMLDESSGIFEQHEGFFNMPHIDYLDIPDDQFPVQKKWPYVDLFRFDLIKQPDVLLFFFLFGSEYSEEALEKNLDYYEPRCSHESSLSPAIHSILSARLGRHKKAYEYARYSSRLDLDDYNNNTCEGLHVTSMAGAWMNLVYGFGGMKTDGDILSFCPTLPASWNGFGFKIHVEDDAVLSVKINTETVSFKLEGTGFIKISVFSELYSVTSDGICIPLPNTHRDQTGIQNPVEEGASGAKPKDRTDGLNLARQATYT